MTNPNVLNMHKQMLEDRIRNVTSNLSIQDSEAFMRVAYALIFDTDYSTPDYDVDVIDGSGDKQIDIVKVEESDDQAIIHLIQIKNNSSYEGTVIVQMREALHWIFERPVEQYETLSNEAFVQKIEEIREVLYRLTPKNVEVVIHYIAKGDTNKLSPDFIQEIENTKNLYGSRDFQNFSFKVWGANELIERSYDIQQEKRRIDVDVPIFTLWQVHSHLTYSTSAIEAAICIVDGKELAKIVAQHGVNLFEENVRTFLGDKKITNKRSVNAEMLRTCSDEEAADFFWFYNNGITATCDNLSIILPANPNIIRITNIQIVNGCQTSMTLYNAMKKGTLSDKTRVLLKVFATKDKDFVDKITLTTNSQNSVTDRDLRSNDELQRSLQQLFESRSYYYERKPRMFKDRPLTRNEKKRILSNEKVGQAYLAVAQRQPAVAMAQSSKIWSDAYYKSIFGSSVDGLLLSYLIYSYCVSRSKQVGKTLSGVDKAITKYGNFHLARIIGAIRIAPYWSASFASEIAKLIKEIESKPDSLEGDYNRAQTMLKSVVEELSKGDTSKLINVFKSDGIRQKLDNVLKKTT